MKKLYFLSLIIATAALFFGCKKDDNELEPTPTNEVDSSQIIQLFSQKNEDIFDNEKFLPKNEETECRCFNTPLTIAFKTLDTEIKLTNTLSNKYRYELTEYSIVDASNENLALSTNKVNNELQAEITHKQLKPNTKYAVNLTVSLQQLVDGEWTTVNWKGKAVSYSNNYSFTTGTIPENAIDKRDILYQYPIDRQYNYMPEEYTQGYIMLGYGYENIFDGIADNDKKVVITGINDNDFEKQVLPYTTKTCHNVPGQVVEINYSLESVSFNPHKIYSIQLTAGEKTIYQMYFRTSRFNTLSEKLKAYDAFDGETLLISEHNDFHSMSRNVTMDEFFDVIDYPLTAQTDGIGLIQFELDLDNCEWYKKTFKNMYDQYSLNDLDIEQRTKWYKFPPSDAIVINNNRIIQHTQLTDEDIQNGTTPELFSMGSIHFIFGNFMVRDARLLSYPVDESINNIFAKTDYPYYITFVLPGKNIVTTKEQHVVTYE